MTLHHHMDALFDHGLTIIRKNEQPIQKEWLQMKQYFEDNGKSLADSTIKLISIFSKAIFSSEQTSEGFIYNLKMDWYDEIGGTNLASPFIFSLLEGSVHYAMSMSIDVNDMDKQAIQYFFLKVNEHIHIQKLDNPFAIDTFIQHLVHSRQLPIEWIATVKKVNDLYLLKKWFHKNTSLTSSKEISANSIYTLGDILLEQDNQNEEMNIMTFPYEDMTLLICTKKTETSNVMPFVHHAVQLLESGKRALEQTLQGQQWMEAVLLFNETILKSHSLTEAIDAVTSGFVRYLPFERCAIFSYSKNDKVLSGLSGHSLDETMIQNITEEIKNLPLIKQSLELTKVLGSGMKYLQPLYLLNARSHLPPDYVEQFNLESIVITPLYTASGNEFIGAAILDQGPGKHFTITHDTYNALIKFGKSAGEILKRFSANLPSLQQVTSFSPREIEVLRLMANGESTTSAATILHLSEYTVRDYITAVMQKMNARNRTEAVARAIRKGII